MSLAPGVRLSAYEILSLIGKGGMGEVYRARDTRLERHVALKVLPAGSIPDTEALERFRREARAASALNHPNIVTIYDFGEAESGHYLAMELIAGRTLRAVAEQPLPQDELIRLAAQMARAICAAHAAGIVHRDIKPENIMVRDDGYVKVLDFGLARLMGELMPLVPDETNATAFHTHGLVLLGTPAYMSPEQIRREALDSATDVFSLGLVWYELATGRHPFQADSMVDLLHAITSEAPVPPSRLNPEISGAFEALILGMLHKEPRLRPTSEEVVARVEPITSGAVQVAQGALSVVGVAPARGRMVGHGRERAELDAAFQTVATGRGLMVCVTGEPGLGKTTLIESFLGELSASVPCRVARGRCSERLGSAGAYLPFLEALASVVRGTGGDAAARTMRLLAPSWYLQLSPRDKSAADLQAAAQWGSHERMKRELAVFLQEMSSAHPLIWFIDDVHWADQSTVELLAYLSNQFESIRMLIVTTFRPSELRANKHPFLSLKLDCQSRGICREIPLSFLGQQDIDAYLAVTFPRHDFPPALPALIHAHTEGNPLFLVELVRHLQTRGVIAEVEGRWHLVESVPRIEHDLPESVSSLIERKIDSLADDDRRLLVAGSVQGNEFDSAVVAGALGRDPAEIEERLDELDSVHGVVSLVGEREFPDHTPSVRYRFVHVLYQNALYASLRATRRVSLNAAVATAMLTHYKDSPEKPASELAMLFEAARDPLRAADHFLLAAQKAARIFAHQEAIVLVRRALAMLQTLPDTTERANRELAALVTLSMPLVATTGYSNPELANTYARAWELCQQLKESPLTVPVLLGTWMFHISSGALPKALNLGEQLQALTRRTQEPASTLIAHAVLGITRICLGELASGRESLEEGLALAETESVRARAVDFGQDAISAALIWQAVALSFLGYPEQALAAERKALARAQETAHPFSLGYALHIAAWVRQLAGDPGGMLTHAETAIVVSKQHGFSQLLAVSGIYQASAAVELGRGEQGLPELRRCLANYRSLGAGLQVPHFLALLANGYAQGQDPQKAMETLDEALALAATHSERLYEPELYRLKSELHLTLRSDGAGEADAGFQHAIAVAQSQGAKLMELRAATSLASLWHRQGRAGEARQMLAGIYGWFTEGFETPDLKEARTVLDRL